MSGPQRSDDAKLQSLIQLDLSFTKAERNNVCQILDLAPKLVQLIYLGNSANQLACIENNNIQELELGFTDILTSLDPAVFYSMSRYTTQDSFIWGRKFKLLSFMCSARKFELLNFKIALVSMYSAVSNNRATFNNREQENSQSSLIIVNTLINVNM